MILKRAISAFVVLGSVWFASCESFPGRPAEKDKWVAPAEISDFDQLYGQNCSGCHGAEGKLGPACPLNDSLYLSFASPDNLRQVIERGVPSTSMPAFGQQFGGNLTDVQVNLLVDQMKARWAHESTDVQIPPYNAANNKAGDAGHGAAAFSMYCAQCHGQDGRGGPKAGSVVDPSFLTLVSDQSLRTTVVIGRQDLGKPDWRSYLPGHPMSPDEISDVVAWISAQRPKQQGTGGPAPNGPDVPTPQPKLVAPPSPAASSSPAAGSAAGKATGQ
jgi:cytochrome c oxidase cbb3-type subunit 3